MYSRYSKDIPEEDLAETGILDQLPSPNGARRASREAKSSGLSKTSNQDPFAIGAPPQGNGQSFFTESEMSTSFFPPPGSQKTSNNASDTSFFPSESSTPTEPQKPQSNLLDIMSEPNPSPTPKPAQNSSSLNSSLLDLDFGSNPTPPQNMGSFGNQGSFGQTNPSVSALNELNFGSTAPTNTFGSNSQDMFGLGSLDSTGMSSFQGQQQQQSFQPQQPQQFASQGSGLFDSLTRTTSAPDSFGSGQQNVPVPAKRASLFDDPPQPTGNPNQQQNSRNFSMDNALQPQQMSQNQMQNQPQMGQTSMFMGQSSMPSQQQQPQQMGQNQMQNQPQMGQNSMFMGQNSMPNQQQMMGQNSMQPQQMGQNQMQNQPQMVQNSMPNQQQQSLMGQNLMGNQQPTNQGQMNQPNGQGMQQNSPTAQELDSLQQLFIQKLKTLPADKQKQMSTQYQQWNAQQRKQFLLQNFGQSLSQPSQQTQQSFQQPPMNQQSQTANQFQQPQQFQQQPMMNQQQQFQQPMNQMGFSQQPQQPPAKGKYANSKYPMLTCPHTNPCAVFGEFDILKSRK